MRLQTPSFWYPKDQSQSVLSTALLPAAWVYETISQTLQNYKTTRKVSVPVLCIGNLVAGGTGKTPAAIAVLTLIKDAGLAQNPFFLTRGYGGASRGPLIVQDNHGYTDVGDEALLLARHAPCVIAADRYAGAQLAVQNGADFIIMDDGLQNPGLYKDFKLIVINGDMGFGNTRLIPAGPLREPLTAGLRRADAYLMIGADKSGAGTLLLPDKPLFNARIAADPAFHADPDTPYLAFAGLGYPEKFFKTLKTGLKLNVVNTAPYPDHHPYADEDMNYLRHKAKALGATLITTEKDMVRIPPPYKNEIAALPVSLHIDSHDRLIDALKTAIR